MCCSSVVPRSPPARDSFAHSQAVESVLCGVFPPAAQMGAHPGTVCKSRARGNSGTPSSLVWGRASQCNPAMSEGRISHCSAAECQTGAFCGWWCVHRAPELLMAAPEPVMFPRATLLRPSCDFAVTLL